MEAEVDDEDEDEDEEDDFAGAGTFPHLSFCTLHGPNLLTAIAIFREWIH